MSSGLSNKMKPIQVSKEDWVEVDGIYYPPNIARAKKAWKTRKAKEEKQKYGNREKKSEILDIIKNTIYNNTGYTAESIPCNIFSLETSEFNLPNMLEDIDGIYYSFYIAQNNKKEYLKMLQNKPTNVKMLYHGNISDFSILNINPSFMFLDFCCTFTSAKKTLHALHKKIRNCDYIFLTLCLRKNKKKLEDYKFDMANKIISIFPKYRFKKVIAYRDKNHSPMIFFVLHNQEPYILDVESRFSYTKIFDNELCFWVKEKLKREYPDVYKMISEQEYPSWGVHKIIDCMNYIDNKHYRMNLGPRMSPAKGYEKMLEKLYCDAILEKKLLIPNYNTSDERFRCNRVCDNMTFFAYFMAVLFSNLGYCWDVKNPTL